MTIGRSQIWMKLAKLDNMVDHNVFQHISKELDTKDLTEVGVFVSEEDCSQKSLLDQGACQREVQWWCK